MPIILVSEILLILLKTFISTPLNRVMKFNFFLKFLIQQSRESLEDVF